MDAYRVLRLPRERVEEVPPEAVVFRRDGPYGAEMLVRRAMISQAFQTEFTTLEDIVLFMIVGGLLIPNVPETALASDAGKVPFLLAAYGGTGVIGVISLLLSERFYSAKRR